MKDDLFERLRAVDPVTGERIRQESRALGDLPGRIGGSEPTNVRRFPKAIRRKATLAAVAAIVVVAIALPLTLLRSIGDGGGSPGTDAGNWVTVGTLAEIAAQGVVYDPEIRVFVMARAGIEPLALSATNADSTGVDKGGRAIYCEPSGRFVNPAGDVFDGTGAHLAGPGTRGLDRFAVRVSSGVVQVDPSAITTDARDSGVGAMDPEGFECQIATGVLLEGEPGFAIPNGIELPPIAVALPQTGAVVESPVPITGSANVFEATVSIRILDANGEVIAEAFTTAACGTGCRGDFSTQVEVPIEAAQPGTIQVFESSARDGSMINTVEVPVTLVPGLAAADTNVEGIWFDGNGAPLPNGSAGSEGTAIAVFRGSEHCQWETATFMHLGWPVRTIATSFDEERQYVRDPESLFDSGAPRSGLHVGFLSDATLPPDAVDTGYHRGPWQLWVSPSQADDAVFIVNGDTGAVERWGRSSQPILCR